jgi:predicted glutamine amidotransferase
MCKIMMFAGIKPSKTSQAWKWAVEAAPLLSEDDKDGFGYAAAAEGQIFGERWLHPEETFLRRTARTKSERYMQAQFGSAVDIPDVYNSFGDLTLTPRVQALMLHARMATCAKSLRNTHPFVQDSGEGPATALIHNGVISNAATLQNRTSSCDSECILNEYTDSNVARCPDNIQDVADLLRGYYACGVLSHDGERPILDVFKSSRASLHVVWVGALGTYVFCTSEEILRETAERAKMRLSTVAAVTEGHLIRLDVVTGRTLCVAEFDDELPGQPINTQWESKTDYTPLMLHSRGT